MHTMRIINKKSGEILGTIITNHSLSLIEACELASVDLDEHDITELHLSTYEESHEIADAEKCARESVEAGLVGGKIPEYSKGEPIMGLMGEHDSMLDGDYTWLTEKFGFVTRAMARAYRSEWNSRLEQAAE
jgi:hypothetical protein